MSRPTKGLDHIESLSGEADTKERLRVVLLTLWGDLSVEEGCMKLGVSPTRFHQIREQALMGALVALSPKAPGRPRSVPLEPPEMEQLRKENAALRWEVEAARIRTEIALVMPHVIKPPAGEEKGGSSPKIGGRPGT